MERVYWHESEDNLLRELWPDRSLSREDIGKRFNPPKTKNAIIGRARRIGLERLKTGPGPQSVRVRTVSGISPRVRQPPPEPPAEPLRVSFMEVGYGQCRAIVDTDERNLAVFCGLHTVWGSRLSYCATHMRGYTYPPRRR